MASVTSRVGWAQSAVADRLEGAAGLVAVLGAAHRGEGVDEVPAVAGLGEAGVEHGDDAAVGGGADQAAGALGEEGGGAGEVDEAEGRRSRPARGGPRGAARRGAGTGCGRWRRGSATRPGTSTPCQKPMVANRLVASSARELLEQPGLGQVALGEDRQVVAEAELEGGGGLVEHAEAGEQRERAAAGRLDEVAELVGERLDVAGVARVGQVGGAVEERVVLVVERAADIELGDLRRAARRGGRAAGRGAWRW